MSMNELIENNVLDIRNCYLTKDEVAKMMRVCRRTVDNYMAWGILPYFKISRSVRFRFGDIDAQLDATCRKKVVVK